jgi:hypothetical protein
MEKPFLVLTGNATDGSVGSNSGQIVMNLATPTHENPQSFHTKCEVKLWLPAELVRHLFGRRVRVEFTVEPDENR